MVDTRHDTVLAKKLLGIFRELMHENVDEAHHILHSIVDPTFTKIHPWEETEIIARLPVPDKECRHLASFQWDDNKFACCECGKDMP